jgi:hypothetical protein
MSQFSQIYYNFSDIFNLVESQNGYEDIGIYSYSYPQTYSHPYLNPNLQPYIQPNPPQSYLFSYYNTHTQQFTSIISDQTFEFHNDTPQFTPITSNLTYEQGILTKIFLFILLLFFKNLSKIIAGKIYRIHLLSLSHSFCEGCKFLKRDK